MALYFSSVWLMIKLDSSEVEALQGVSIAENNHYY
jgi:hypothetical protein